MLSRLRLTALHNNNIAFVADHVATWETSIQRLLVATTSVGVPVYIVCVYVPLLNSVVCVFRASTEFNMFALVVHKTFMNIPLE